jgi:hypothetical protein
MWAHRGDTKRDRVMGVINSKNLRRLMSTYVTRAVDRSTPPRDARSDRMTEDQPQVGAESRHLARDEATRARKAQIKRNGGKR